MSFVDITMKHMDSMFFWGSAIKKKMVTQTNYAQDHFKSPLMEILENIPGYLTELGKINTLTVPLPDKGYCEQLKMIQVQKKPQA